MDFKKILFKTNSIDVEKALPDAIVFIAKDGKIQWVNDVASEIFETPKMHLLTSNISDFIENPMGVISNTLSNNKPVISKIVDKEVYLDMTAREIDDGYVLDFRDILIKEDKDSKCDDEVVNREKNNFLLKLSNDLKGPIQSIVGFSQAMTDGLGGSMSEQQEKYIRIINKNSSELMYFIAKLLDLSRTESEKKVPDNKPFDVVALINSIVKFNEQLYKGKDLKISVNSTELETKTIVSDSEILKEILQNTFEVIMKAVEMGEIAINLSIPTEEYIFTKQLPKGSYLLISIASNSLLLTENDLDCMFDPYKILDTANRKNVLRAIILASVKNLVSQLCGLIWVESQILKSTNFNIIIPIK